MRRTFLIAPYLTAQLVFMATGAWAATYQIRNIDSLIPPSLYGGALTAINDNSQIVGWTYVDPQGRNTAFLSQEGMPIQVMDIVGHIPVPRFINNNGQAVGVYRTYIQGREYIRAFLWQAGSPMRDLGTLGGFDSFAYGINISGQVVGVSWTASKSDGNTTNRAFLWQDGSPMRDLGTLGERNSEAKAINDSGQVVGSASITIDLSHAFLWQDGSPMRDLGSLGTNSTATAINSVGQVVGFSNVPNANSHAFFWQDGSTMLDIGTLGGMDSTATAINGSGIVVGYSGIATNPYAKHAFIWQLGSEMQDLGTLGGTNSFAYGINSSGQIVGSAEDVNGIIHAVLWEPVPEPSSIMALAGGIVGLGGLALKRRKA